MAPSVARLARMLPLFGLLVSTRSFAQSDPSSASFPQEPPAAAPTTPAQAPVAQAPAPAPAPEPAPDQPPPPAAAPAPAPAPAPAAATAPPAAYEPEYPPPPPPPEPPKGEGFKMPPFSVRIDPFNWLINGKLGFEVEVGLLDFMSVELVPQFVVSEQPPSFSISGREDTLYLESDGLGPLSGSSISLGFWLEGKALHGYVLRAILTNYSYQYIAKDANGEFDNVSHVDRHFYGYFGSHAVWGVFTLAGGLGLGVELNKERRCFEADGTPTRSGCDNELLIKADRSAETVADLSGGLGGVQILFRLSLGITID